MQVKTHVKAGRLAANHNQTLLRDRVPALRQSLEVKTHVKAGGVALNHNQTLVRDTARQRQAR